MKSCRNSQTIMIGTYKNISITQQLLETIEIIDWLSKNCFDKSWVLLRDFFELLSNIFFTNSNNIICVNDRFIQLSLHPACFLFTSVQKNKKAKIFREIKYAVNQVLHDEAIFKFYYYCHYYIIIDKVNHW